MKLNNDQKMLMQEAGIQLPDKDEEYEYTAEDEDLLADFLMNSLDDDQDMTPKAVKIRDLLDYLASESD